MENVENVYPLTPMQELMLLHAVSRPRFDTLFSQFRYELHGPVDSDRFRVAWQTLTNRHPALRTMFLWDNLKRPMQVVRKSVELPYTYVDWTDCSHEEQSRRFDSFCRKDRVDGFEVTRAPLHRIFVARRDANTHYLLWSNHHLVLDRWCITTLFEELEALLSNTRSNSRLPEPVPFSRYLEWVGQQDHRSTEAFWRELLKGCRNATVLAKAENPESAHGGRGSNLTTARQLQLSDETSFRLRALARERKTTVGVLAQCAWALTLNRRTGLQDVLFGTAVSGRPPDLIDVDQIIGSFVTNVPTRVSLGANQCLADVLGRIKLDQQRRLRHEYVSPADIQRWIEPSVDSVLFDSVLVWLADSPPLQLPGLRIESFSGELQTAYPLTIGIEERTDGYRVMGRLQGGFSLDSSLASLLADLAEMLDALTRLNLESPLVELPGFRGSLPMQHWNTAVRSPQQNSRMRMRDKTERFKPGTGRERLESAVLRDLLLGEWQSVLGIDNIDPDADFFDSGGDSLDAVKLHARIEAAIRQDVPIMSLFQMPTVAQMTDLLDARDWPLKPETLTPLRSVGSRAPLFCIASPEVNTLGYTLVARHMSEDQPVYVLQAPPQSDELDRLSLEALPTLAAEYVEELKLVQPEGPYHLLGMCTGSHLAFEMAREIEKHGGEIRFFGIINTWAHFTVSRLYHLERLRSRWRWYANRIAQVTKQDGPEQRAVIRDIARARLATWRQRLHLGRCRSETLRCGQLDDVSAAVASSEISDSQGKQDWIGDLGWAHRWTASAAMSVAAPITVFRIQRQPYWRTPDRALGWERFSSAGAREVALPTQDHDDILREPYVRNFTALLVQTLEAVGTKGFEAVSA